MNIKNQIKLLMHSTINEYICCTFRGTYLKVKQFPFSDETDGAYYC